MEQELNSHVKNGVSSATLKGPAVYQEREVLEVSTVRMVLGRYSTWYEHEVWYH